MLTLSSFQKPRTPNSPQLTTHQPPLTKRLCLVVPTFQKAKPFEESKHPRAADGEFGSGGGGAVPGKLKVPVIPKAPKMTADQKAQAEAKAAALAEIKSATGGSDAYALKELKFLTPEDAYARYGLASGAYAQRYGMDYGQSDDAQDDSASEERDSKTGLTVSDHEAISDYTDGFYDSINNNLRRGGKPGSRAALIDKVMARKTTDRQMTVYRGFSADAFAGVAEISTALVGRTIMDKGFISTSTSRDFAEYWDAPFLAIIKVPENAHGFLIPDSVTYSPGQDEFLLNRGSRFKVTAVDLSGTKPVIHLSVLVRKARQSRAS